MRPDSPTLRSLMKAGSVVVIWLLAAGVSFAAGHPPRRSPGHPANASSVETFKKIRRHIKAIGGPLARPQRQRVLVMPVDPGGRMQRASHARLGDQEAAISNDAPDAPILSDPVAELQALGEFVDALQPQLRSRSFSPRSPRGPPFCT